MAGNRAHGRPLDQRRPSRDLLLHRRRRAQARTRRRRVEQCSQSCPPGDRSARRGRRARRNLPPHRRVVRVRSGMADPDGDGHRVRARCARRVRQRAPEPAARVPARPRRARRPDRDPHHRGVLHHEPEPGRASARRGDHRALRPPQPVPARSDARSAGRSDGAAGVPQLVARAGLGRARDDRGRRTGSGDGPQTRRTRRPPPRTMVERADPPALRVLGSAGADPPGRTLAARPGLLGHPDRAAGRQADRHHPRRLAGLVHETPGRTRQDIVRRTRDGLRSRRHRLHRVAADERTRVRRTIGGA